MTIISLNRAQPKLMNQIFISLTKYHTYKDTKHILTLISIVHVDASQFLTKYLSMLTLRTLL